MTRAEKINLVKQLLRDAIKKAKSDLGDGHDRVIRYAVFVIAREQLDGWVRELVWAKPPFPEEEDHE